MNPLAPKIDVYSLNNYAITTKESQFEEDSSLQAKLKNLQKYYEVSGTRVSVEAVLLVQEHKFPHVLVLQVSNGFFRLPGDYLTPSEVNASGNANTNTSKSGNADANNTEVQALKRSLNRRLAPLKSDAPDETEVEELDWRVTELLATWYRPNFESYTYPYKPAHVSNPKEIRKLYLVELPERRKLCVPKNMKLLAVPLFELYDNNAKYGQQFSALAHNLSKFNLNFQ